MHVGVMAYLCVRHVSCLIHMLAIPHLYVRHDSFICTTRLIHMYVMTHSCMRHDSFTHVRHDSFICAS